ncbi:MAG: hypothetical protein KIT44_08980 [Opitutaceae bacterium]|nr:hypothetical protein [Opitutaceae bacterium]
MKRIGLIASATWRASRHQRVFALTLIAALLLVAGTLWLRPFNFGSSELKFVADLGLGILSLGGAFLAVGVTVQVFFDATENRTLHLVLTHGVRRGEFILGQLGGVVLLLGAFTLPVLALLWSLLWVRETALLADAAGLLDGERMLRPGGVLVAGMALWLKACVLAAAVLWLCTFAGSRLFALGTGFLLFVVFHAHPMLVLPGESAGAVATVLGWLLRLLPDFTAFDAAAAFYGDGRDPVRMTGYAIVYVAAFSWLAARQLHQREL